MTESPNVSATSVASMMSGVPETPRGCTSESAASAASATILTKNSGLLPVLTPTFRQSNRQCYAKDDDRT